jgi:tRNA nucleotidyltransferase/poly(A) polymerase
MNNIKIYEVGGSIRNELLGMPAKDRDFAMIAPDYNTMRQYLLDNGAKIYQERPQFVSIRAKMEPMGAVDFTLAREESFYTDARHPDNVTPAKTIEDDLARRDFTMNAIAREVSTSELIDPYDGMNDINNRVIVAVGNAKLRFTEDRLRIFRAIRFACQLNMLISAEIFNAINEFDIQSFDCVTKEMIQIEMEKAFKANTKQALNMLSDFPDLLTVMIKKGIWLKPTLEEK